MIEQEGRALRREAVLRRRRRLGVAARLAGGAVRIRQAAALPVRAHAAREARRRHVTADVLVGEAQIEGGVEVPPRARSGAAHRRRSLVGAGEVLDDRLGHHAAARVPPDVGVLRLPVLLHEVPPQVLDVLYRVLHVPADRAEGGDGRRIPGRHGGQTRQQEQGYLARVGGERGQDALVGRVAVRIDEQAAVPVLRHDDHVLRALDRDALHRVLRRGGAGQQRERNDCSSATCSHATGDLAENDCQVNAEAVKLRRE